MDRQQPRGIADLFTAHLGWRTDTSGFAAFLGLPVEDQLRLLYIDYLDRPLDSNGMAHYAKVVGSGRQDILAGAGRTPRQPGIR